jgi:hypothetical protein
MDFMLVLSVLGVLVCRFLLRANTLDICNKKLKVYKKTFDDSGNKKLLDRWFFLSLTKKAVRFEVLPAIYCALNLLNHVWIVLLIAAELVPQGLTAGLPLSQISNYTVYALAGELLIVFVCTALDAGA